MVHRSKYLVLVCTFVVADNDTGDNTVVVTDHATVVVAFVINHCCCFITNIITTELLGGTYSYLLITNNKLMKHPLIPTVSSCSPPQAVTRFLFLFRFCILCDIYELIYIFLITTKRHNFSRVGFSFLADHERSRYY